MKTKITYLNNFCRIFELPEEYPEGFCFDGAKPVVFNMVDWFNPMPSDQIQTTTWEKMVPKLKAFMINKPYIKNGKKYILITDFGESLIIEKQPTQNP